MPLHRVESVLSGDPDPQDGAFSEQLFDAINTLRTLGFEMELEADEVAVDGTVEMVWEEIDERLGVTLYRAADTGICKMTLVAPRASELRVALEVLGTTLNFEALPELLARSQRGLLLDPSVLLKIAIVAERPEPEVVERLIAGLEHRGHTVRYYAAYAMATTRWPVFILELERLLKLEPNAEVQDMAERALSACQREERRAVARR